jgi:adenylosuccinate synthase
MAGQNNIIVVLGLGYGDEGKGTTIDYLGSVYGKSAVIRYHGGSQCAHNVVRPDGRHHCFSQLTSNLLSHDEATGYVMCQTYLDLLTLDREIDIIKEKIHTIDNRLFVDHKTRLITPYHVILGMARETARLDNRLGTVGCGVGETHRQSVVKDDLSIRLSSLNLPKIHDFIADLMEYTNDEFKKLVTDKNREVLHQYGFFQKLSSMSTKQYIENLLDSYYTIIEKHNIDTHNEVHVSDLIDNNNITIYESGQGILLNPSYGFAPYITKTDNLEYQYPSCGNCDWDDIKVLGVMRTLMTRHGNGPFVTEDPDLKSVMDEKHNIMNEWQGDFRTGWPDLVATSYAAHMGGIRGIVMTHYDTLQKLDGIKVCVKYNLNDVVYRVGRDAVSEHFNETTNKTEIYPDSYQPDNDKIECFSEHIPNRTAILQYAKPIYKEFTGKDWRTKFVSFVEKYLELPVVLISNGSTYKDKNITNNSWWRS